MSWNSLFSGKTSRRLSQRRSYRPGLENLEDRTVPATLPTGFTETVVASGLSGGPTAMEFSPQGKLFITEQNGTMSVWQNGTKLSANFFLNSPINTETTSERGLLGVTFDPNYNTNHLVYVYYTINGGDHHNRVSRFTADAAGNLALAGSEQIIWEGDAHSAGNHNGGAIHFGPDGKLYIATGDNAQGSTTAQSLTSQHGKILRINADGTIPTDNPFYDGAGPNRDAIWSLGLRNPFTFTFQPGTGRMFINDVGQNTWEEINEGGAGRNFGWATTEGTFNQGSFPNFTNPFYAYNHSSGVTTPSGNVITGGAFYNPATNQFPSDYQGDYFFADLGGGWIYRIDTTTKQVTQFATGAGAVDMKVGSDGSLYYASRFSNQVFKVSFTASSAPSISQQPQNQTVGQGQAVTFNVNATGTPAPTFQWQRSNDNGTTWNDISGATAKTYSFTAQAGDNNALFRARATNSAGTATSNAAQLTVQVNHAPNAPTITITSGLTNGKFIAGQAINFAGSATDQEDGTLGAGAFSWTINYLTSINQGDQDGDGLPGLTRPFSTLTNATSGTFTPSTTGPYTLTDVAYSITLTVRDAQGLTATQRLIVDPNTATITLASNPSGLQLTRDTQPVTAPNVFTSVVGFLRPIGAAATQVLGGVTYNFVSWSDGGAAAHNVATPATNTTYTANYVAATPAAPGSLTATAVSASQINLSWLDNSTNESGFQLQRATDSAFTQNVVTTNLGANSTSTQATGLAASTTYYFRLRAVNGSASSAYTSTASATTQPAAAVSVKINFQDSTSAGFAGYLADTGAVFGNRGNGWSYGWNINNSSTARNRNASNSPDERYDTLQHMQKPENPNAVWEITVANGTYTVHVVSGDPQNIDSVFRTNVEGVLAVRGTPTAAQHWFEGTVTVTVTDGRLTISNGSGAQNNKINYIDISSVTTAPSGAFQQDSGADGLVVMEAENATGNVSQGGKSWVAYTATAGFAGSGALITTPNTGVNNDTGYTTTSPRLDFQVNFTKTGTHYVWIRGIGPTGSDDSVHVGLDGAAVSTADRISSFATSGYGWTKSTMDGVVATINVTTTGLHTVNLWMREDGTIVDRVLLTTNASYTPTGAGPAESGRGGSGLAATYFDNSNFTGASVTRTDATVNFDWGTGAPVAGILADTFSARWSGQIRPETSGTYTFSTTSDDGVRLRINGQTIIDQWNDHAATTHSGTIALQGGQSYAIELEYYENGGYAVMKLEWELPGVISRQVVPSSRLYRS